jgi:hypothetical protein
MLFPEPDGIFEPALGIGPKTQPEAMADILVDVEFHMNRITKEW